MSRLTKKKAMQVADVETTLTLGRQELDAEAVDWQAVEVRFNELNALRTAPRGGLNASRAREEQGERVADAIETLLDGCQAACRRLLIEGDAKAAIEGGLKALKLKESYYSPGSLKLIPSYFHLARTNQYMDRFKAAEEFLSLAQWIILKNSSTDTALQAELHQTYGLLYASDGRLDAALKQLALATYFLTELNGPNSILTSFGYFDLGNVFAAMGGMEAAMAYYDKVKDIWYDHLTLSFQYEPFGTEARPEGVVTVEKLGEDNVQDALRMHKGIVGLQTDRFTTVHPCTGKATLVLGLYYVWISDHSDAQETLCQSLEIHKRVYGVSHATVSVIESYMTQVGYPVPDSTEHYLDPPHDDAPAQQEQGNAAADALPAGAEADAAAVKIQAVHRGRAARKLAADESRRKQAPSPGEADPGAGPQEAQAGEEDGNAPQEAQSGERDGTAPQGAQSGEGDAQEAQVGEEDGTAPQEAQSGDVNGTAPEEAQLVKVMAINRKKPRLAKLMALDPKKRLPLRLHQAKLSQKQRLAKYPSQARLMALDRKKTPPRKRSRAKPPPMRPETTLRHPSKPPKTHPNQQQQQQHRKTKAPPCQSKNPTPRKPRPLKLRQRRRANPQKEKHGQRGVLPTTLLLKGEKGERLS
eukprot:gene8445-13020_t